MRLFGSHAIESICSISRNPILTERVHSIPLFSMATTVSTDMDGDVQLQFVDAAMRHLTAAAARPPRRAAPTFEPGSSATELTASWTPAQQDRYAPSAPDPGFGVDSGFSMRMPSNTDLDGYLSARAEPSLAAPAEAAPPTSDGTLVEAQLGEIGSTKLVEAEREADEKDGDGDQTLTCGEYICKETGQRTKVCFVPKGRRSGQRHILSSAQLQRLFVGHWKLDPPKTLIVSDAGNLHPKDFATPGLVALPSFRNFRDAAQQQALRAGVNEGAGCLEGVNEFALKIINEVLFAKLVNVFAALLDAATIHSRTPNWLIIDYVQSPSPAGECMLIASLIR